MILEVTVPNEEIFCAYFYGYGTVMDGYPLSCILNGKVGLLYHVDYGDDVYRAMYQRDRFQSGLYWASCFTGEERVEL